MHIFFIVLGLAALIIQFFIERGFLKRVLVVVSILSFIGLGAIGYSDKTTSDALKEKTNKLQNQLEYSEVSKFNYIGLPFNTGPGMEISSDLSNLIKPIIKNTNPLTIDCSSSSIQNLNKAITINSKFPFSYYYLAFCKRALNISGWEENIDSARNILLITTKIPDHNLNHDEFLNSINLNPNFDPIKKRPVLYSP